MPSSNSIQVLCVTNTDEGGQSLTRFLRAIPGLSLQGQASSAEEALQELNSKTIDVVIVDLALRTVTGFDLTRQIREAHPTVRVLICTASNTPDDIFAAMDAGADAYVLKGNSKGLESAIRSVKLGTVWLDPGIATQVLEVIVNSTWTPTRTLPTGLMVLPLLPAEKKVLDDLAASNCENGVCMVDPSFVKKLRRYAPQTS